MRQVIIARKDLQMSAGKLAAQCCHASLAFITSKMRDRNKMTPITDANGEIGYATQVVFKKDIYEDWISGVFTKTVCEARNLNHLMKAVAIATDELGMKEGEDFFIIKDCCLTELEPEEVDENGVGRTTTCIGFRPLPDDIAHTISKKFQLHR